MSLFIGPIRLKSVMLSCLFLLSGNAGAQEEPVVFTEYLLKNSRPLNAFRYVEMDGDPYLFKDWVDGDIITNRFEIFKDVTLNFNGFTGEFEVKKGDAFIELDHRFYLRIEVDAEKNPGVLDPEAGKLIFQRGMHPRFMERYAQIVFSGKKMLLLRDFEVVIAKSSLNALALGSVKDKFRANEVNFLLYGGKLNQVQLRKKDFIKIFGHKKEIEAYLAEQELNFDSDEDLRKLLVFCDSLLNQAFPKR